MPLTKNVRIVALLLLSALLVGLLSGCADQTEPAPAQESVPETATPAPTLEATPESTAFEVLTASEVFEINRDAVLIIRVDLGGGRFGTGSGFFVCSSGLAVTNHHVIDGAVAAIAILYDGREFEVIGYYSYDLENDLAVIQIDGRGYNFDYVVFGDSDAARVGDDVFAIGGPEWDPITFTSGMISRIAYESISFGIYSVSGMFQNTAAIYGGNSGGPLINNRGQVIGVNAAGNPARASVQFAIPSNRIILPVADTVVNPLPVGGVPPHQHAPGYIFYYDKFPFIPDFMSVSQHGTFAISGAPIDLGFTFGGIFDYLEYVFIYNLPSQHWEADTEAFIEVLFASGFVFLTYSDFGFDIWLYFYHPFHNVSLSYAFIEETDILTISVSQGNVYEETFYDDPYPEASSHLIGSWTDGSSVFHYFANRRGLMERLDENGVVIVTEEFRWVTVNIGSIRYLMGSLAGTMWSYNISEDGDVVTFTGEDGGVVSMLRLD